MNNQRLAKLVIGLFLLVACLPSALAEGSFELSMAEKSQAAQVIVIGVISSKGSTIPGRKSDTVEVLVEAVLKNETAQPIEIGGEVHFVHNWSSENRVPWCCAIGGRYLFFMTELKGSSRHFVSANGSYGVYRIRNRKS